MHRDQGEAVPRLVTVARQVWTGSRGPGDFMDTFVGTVVFAQRPERPALLVADLGNRGCWMVAFSSIERLAAYAGECEYFSTTGADLLELIPPGIGLMVDPEDEHRFPVLSRMAPPDVVAQTWSRMFTAQQQGRATA